jgi:hypothetical protein
MKAGAALHACDVNLGIALRSLLASDDGDPCSASQPYDVPPPQISNRIFSRG